MNGKTITSAKRDSRMTRRVRARAGNSVIEMVFAMQVLLFVSFGMVEFGQFFYIRHAFEAAVRDGARVAILATATQTQVDNTIKATLLQANVTGYSAATWLTMTHSSDGTNYSSMANISSASTGDTMCFVLSTNYSQLANAVRPLSSLTAQKAGIGTAKVISAQATMVKE